MRASLKKVYRSIKDKIVKFFRKDGSALDFKKEIEDLQTQITFLTKITKEQSAIIVSLARVQAEICNTVEKLENSNTEEDCFLIKIPIKNSEISN